MMMFSTYEETFDECIALSSLSPRQNRKYQERCLEQYEKLLTLIELPEISQSSRERTVLRWRMKRLIQRMAYAL